MKRDELLKQCRYYKGEENVPNGGSAMFAEYEQDWVNLTLNNPQYIDNLTNEYFLLIGKTAIIDDTPDSLKAILFNRYTHWHPYWNKAEFIIWYKTEYKKTD